jgi:hypothetical protein
LTTALVGRSDELHASVAFSPSAGDESSIPIGCVFISEVVERTPVVVICECIPKPVRILPRYSRGVYTGLGVKARLSHPRAKGTLRARRATRRPNRSSSGPHSKHPSGVATDATLAETGVKHK